MTAGAERGKRGVSLPALDSGRLAVVLAALLPVTIAFREPLRDTDLWWHLAAGKWIVDAGRVPWTDPFSHTASGHPWIAYSWLAEVLLHELTSRAGFAALIYWKAAMLVGFAGALYLSCRAGGSRRAIAAVVTAAAALAGSGGFGERPQLFTLVFLATLGWLLRSGRLRSHRIWLAPAMIALWANLHVLFVAGLALLALAAACEAIGGRPSGRLWAATGVAAIAALANPYGPYLYAHLPTIARQPQIARAVTEFQSPDFATPLGVMIAVFLLGSIVVLALARERLTLFELLTFVVPLGMGLYMVRNMALFAILAAPTVARRLESLLPGPGQEDERGGRYGPGAMRFAVAAIAIGFVTSLAPGRPGWRDHVAPDAFPVAAVDFVEERYRGARLFNEFGWGGFLIYRLFPQSQVSIDGRTQVYGERILSRYLRSHFALPGWERFLDASAAEIVIWPASGPFATLLRERADWRLAYSDRISVVFERVAAASADPAASADLDRVSGASP